MSPSPDSPAPDSSAPESPSPEALASTTPPPAAPPQGPPALASPPPPERRRRARLGILSAVVALVLALGGGGIWALTRSSDPLSMVTAPILQAQQDVERRLAVATERARIARDVHDLLGHCLSVISMQAAGARAVLAADPGAAAARSVPMR